MEMPKIIQWFMSNKIHINVNKTVAMLFHTKQKRANIDKNLIVIDGNIIPFTTNRKFLGINIDNNLTWKAHINNITTKISNGVGVRLRLSKELSYNILFGDLPIRHIYIPQSLFKKAMRIIIHSPFQCLSSPLFERQTISIFLNNRIQCLHINISKTK